MRVDVTKDEVLEEGIYEATITGLETKDTQFGERLMWRFTTEENVEIVGFSSFSGSTKSKLIKWSTAVLGELEDGFDTEDLIGKPCRISLGLAEDADGNERNKVEKVMAPKKGQKPKTVATPQKTSAKDLNFASDEDFDEQVKNLPL